MPAETHTTREGIDARDVLDLIDALVGSDDAPIAADTLLADAGLDDDLAIVHIWSAAAEEYAERAIADLDMEELLLARTVGELAHAIMRAVQGVERPDFTAPR